MGRTLILAFAVAFGAGSIARAELMVQYVVFNAAASQALRDLDFLLRNARNCTVYDEKVRDELMPRAQKLLSFKVRVDRKLGSLLRVSGQAPSLAGKDCLNLKNASENYKKNIESHLAAELELAEVSTELEALVADILKNDAKIAEAFDASKPEKYPKCIPEIKGDKHSNPESKAYISLKSQLQQMRASLRALKVDTLAQRKLLEGHSMVAASAAAGCGNPARTSSSEAPFAQTFDTATLREPVTFTLDETI